MFAEVRGDIQALVVRVILLLQCYQTVLRGESQYIKTKIKASFASQHKDEFMLQLFAHRFQAFVGVG